MGLGPRSLPSADSPASLELISPVKQAERQVCGTFRSRPAQPTLSEGCPGLWVTPAFSLLSPSTCPPDWWVLPWTLSSANCSPSPVIAAGLASLFSKGTSSPAHAPPQPQTQRHQGGSQEPAALKRSPGSWGQHAVVTGGGSWRLCLEVPLSGVSMGMGPAGGRGGGGGRKGPALPLCPGPSVHLLVGKR